MDVEKWMRRDVVTISPQDTLLKADRLMTAYQIRHLPVLDAQGNIMGILSDRDLRDHALPSGMGAAFPANQQLLQSIAVEKIMTHKVFTVEQTEPMEKVVWLMKTKRINCLPITHQGRLSGLITSTILLNFLHAYMSMHPGQVRLEIALSAQADMAGLLTVLQQHQVAFTQLHCLPAAQPPAVDVGLIVSSADVEPLTQVLGKSPYHLVRVQPFQSEILS